MPGKFKPAATRREDAVFGHPLLRHVARIEGRPHSSNQVNTGMTTHVNTGTLQGGYLVHLFLQRHGAAGLFCGDSLKRLGPYLLRRLRLAPIVNVDSNGLESVR